MSEYFKHIVTEKSKTKYIKIYKPTSTYLINIIITGQVRLPPQEFGKDTPHTPKINRFGILMTSKHNLWRPVPSRHHIFRQQIRWLAIIVEILIVSGGYTPGQSKITYLKVAVGIDEEIGWFEITVDDIGRMHVFHSTQDLIEKVLHVINGQGLLGVDDPMEVGLHEICHNVHVTKIFHVSCEGRHHIHNRDDVLVMKMFEEFNLSQDTLGIYLIMKGLGDHLNRNV